MITPNPGSLEARAAGCRCPVWDNHHGRGYMGGAKDASGNTVFVYHEDCPIHRQAPTQADRLAALGRHPSNSPFALQKS